MLEKIYLRILFRTLAGTTYFLAHFARYVKSIGHFKVDDLFRQKNYHKLNCSVPEHLVAHCFDSSLQKSYYSSWSRLPKVSKNVFYWTILGLCFIYSRCILGSTDKILAWGLRLQILIQRIFWWSSRRQEGHAVVSYHREPNWAFDDRMGSLATWGIVWLILELLYSFYHGYIRLHEGQKIPEKKIGHCISQQKR